MKPPGLEQKRNKNTIGSRLQDRIKGEARVVKIGSMSNYSTFIKKTLRVTYTDNKHCLKCVDAKQEESHKAKEGEIIAGKTSLALKKRLWNWVHEVAALFIPKDC